MAATVSVSFVAPFTVKVHDEAVLQTSTGCTSAKIWTSPVA